MIRALYYFNPAFFLRNSSFYSCSPVWTEADPLALLGHEVVTAVLHIVPALGLVRVRPTDQVTACRGSGIHGFDFFLGGGGIHYGRSGRGFVRMY